MDKRKTGDIGMDSRNIGIVAIMVAASLWAIDGVILRPSLYHLNIFAVVFLEHLIAFIFMAGFLIYEFDEIKKLKSMDWISFGLVGLFGGAIGGLAITKALFYVNYINLSAVFFLQKLQPVFAIILARIILKEKPKKYFYALASVAIIGSYFITFGFNKPVFDAGNQVFLASVFAIVAAASWGSSTVFSKFAITKINFRVGTYLRFGITTFIMIVMLSLTRNWNTLNDVTLQNIKTLLIIAFTTGGAAIFIYYYGLKKVSASVSTICELTFPFVGVVLEFFIHDKLLSIGQWFGAILLLASIYVITMIKPIRSKIKDGNRRTA